MSYLYREKWAHEIRLMKRPFASPVSISQFQKHNRNLRQEPLNRCHHLSAPCKRLIHDLKRNRQTNNRRTENNSKTVTDQSLQRSRLDDESHHDKTDQSNQDQRHII